MSSIVDMLKYATIAIIEENARNKPHSGLDDERLEEYLNKWHNTGDGVDTIEGLKKAFYKGQSEGYKEKTARGYISSEPTDEEISLLEIYLHGAGDTVSSDDVLSAMAPTVVNTAGSVADTVTDAETAIADSIEAISKKDSVIKSMGTNDAVADSTIDKNATPLEESEEASATDTMLFEEKLVSKYLTKSDVCNINELTSAIEDEYVVITCIGLYNHGKSTLLNVLINDFEYKTFKTADVRETTKNTIYNDGENGIKYVDTPGLNAKGEDDKKVMEAIQSSDITLFVHASTTGEFNKKEIEYLNNIKKYWKTPQEFIERTIFVLSRIDNANNQEEISNAVKKMSQQIIKIFNTTPTIIPVSAMRYRKGKVEDKKIMIKKSNIEVLEKSLKNLSDELSNSINETRKIRLKNKYDDLIRQLNSKVQTNKLEITKQEQAQKKYLVVLNSDIKQVESTLTNMYSKLEEV